MPLLLAHPLALLEEREERTRLGLGAERVDLLEVLDVVDLLVDRPILAVELEALLEPERLTATVTDLGDLHVQLAELRELAARVQDLLQELRGPLTSGLDLLLLLPALLLEELAVEDLEVDVELVQRLDDHPGLHVPVGIDVLGRGLERPETGAEAVLVEGVLVDLRGEGLHVSHGPVPVDDRVALLRREGGSLGELVHRDQVAGTERHAGLPVAGLRDLEATPGAVRLDGVSELGAVSGAEPAEEVVQASDRLPLELLEVGLGLHLGNLDLDGHLDHVRGIDDGLSLGATETSVRVGHGRSSCQITSMAPTRHQEMNSVCSMECTLSPKPTGE